MNVLESFHHGDQKNEHPGSKEVWIGYDALEYEGKCYFMHFTYWHIFIIVYNYKEVIISPGVHLIHMIVEKNKSVIPVIVPS